MAKKNYLSGENKISWYPRYLYIISYQNICGQKQIHTVWYSVRQSFCPSDLALPNITRAIWLYIDPFHQTHKLYNFWLFV